MKIRSNGNVWTEALLKSAEKLETQRTILTPDSKWIKGSSCPHSATKLLKIIKFKKFHVGKKNINTLIKMYNGNGVLSRSISIVHWNMGLQHWKRKQEDVEALVLQKKPDLLFVTEANIIHDTPDYQRQIPGYYLILPLIMEMQKYARIALLVRNGLEVKKKLKQHMASDLATIWVKIGQQGRKPLVVGVFTGNNICCSMGPPGEHPICQGPWHFSRKDGGGSFSHGKQLPEIRNV